MKSIPVFYTPKMVAPSLSFSPSSMKPEKVVDAWLKSEIPIEIIDVSPMDDADICLAHQADFVRGVLSGKISNGFANRSLEIANTLLYTNASMRDAAVAAIKNGAMAVSPTSGFHHAFHATASAFCTFNGLMIAAVWLLNNRYARKVGIIDCDYHYGNGTDDIIKELNLHARIEHFTAGREFHTSDQADEFLHKLYDVVGFMQGCDVVLYQAGADPHIDDPLGGFLSTEQMYLRDLIVFSECKQRSIPVAWNLAGGYQQHEDDSTNWEALTEIHTNTLKACWQVTSGEVTHVDPSEIKRTRQKMVQQEVDKPLSDAEQEWLEQFFKK
jgi:acetoin utilization deacetylase AcuC-like enzyme